MMSTAYSLMRVLGNATLDCVIASNINGRIIFWNTRSATLFGWLGDEVLGKAFDEVLIPERFRAEHLSGFQSLVDEVNSAPLRLQTQCLHKDGFEVPVELSAVLIELDAMRIPVFFLRDLSMERQRDRFRQEAQNQRLYFSRQNAIGTMATALAHEMAQPLGTAQNYLSVALMHGDHPAQDALARCRDALSEAAATLTSIRGVFRKGFSRPKRISVREVVEDALALFSSRPEGVKVQVRVSQEHMAWADQMHVEQIVVAAVSDRR